jgi:hypothetical protein
VGFARYAAALEFSARVSLLPSLWESERCRTSRLTSQMQVYDAGVGTIARCRLVDSHLRIRASPFPRCCCSCARQATPALCRRREQGCCWCFRRCSWLWRQLTRRKCSLAAAPRALHLHSCCDWCHAALPPAAGRLCRAFDQRTLHCTLAPPVARAVTLQLRKFVRSRLNRCF